MRRHLTPSAAVLFVLVIAFGMVATFVIQDAQKAQRATQETFRRNALTGCKRANAQNAALLDLGTIITAARGQTPPT